MSSSTKTHRPAPKAGSESNSQRLPTFDSAMLGTLGEAGSAYLRGVASLNREIGEFINKRLEHDAELGRALGQCKDWQEAAELQQAWMREASEEYAANARTLMEMTNRLLDATWTPLRHKGTGASGSAGE